MLHIILGMVMIAVGALLVAKSEWMLNNFGRMEWFELHMGGGGSRMGYKLIGLAIIFLGILFFTNMIGGFLTWVLSPLFRFNTF
ncbi:hypothetical protein A2303_00885 [Candidatus Falkowbacteria bacterium RIFOXYB2_FULL_47_14]|uniref:Uncharacterized protein n=1 Tax=Candidatus Falkowbacteria bacterium RIFOXYA2_FULL_47_19 TaxID=1797994 RepID=A0A1F5SFW8_9BACT|nr:MAG: hypothetical protein A2227_00085 [Candidatus Falkowbacteria bacterium RIFOXYA2_FULL_47_19]OGF35593.1 MAG: hypothetical protein A2468_06190 [Candidatus Falkowbacteria bacterium RIFOXYC2_FULL_46_15]OGF42923.1 MAG: hypothetical protein A2303_00885 [Candidatus Falkowbacteria bacterium RIFOXYB2_FULL_47_14]